MIASDHDHMPSATRLALAVLPVLLVGAARPPERVFRVDNLLPTRINGITGNLLVDPGAPSIVLISKVFADRARLKAGPFGIGWGVGPVTVPGRTAVARIDLGHGLEKKRIGWTERPYVADADGSVGPGGLDDDVIRFVLHEPRAGEREAVLPMLDGGGVFGGAAGLFGRIDLDGAAVRVRFDLRHRASTTTAGTALTLARIHAGTLAPAARPVEIAFGVERPVRTMTLARPLAVGNLAIATIDVRTNDYGNAEGIAAAGSRSDPDEVVVTAKGRRDRSRDRITIGADALSACSSITFDKRAKVVRLRCA